MNRTAARVVVLGLIGASLLAGCSGPGSSSERASAGLSGGGGSTGGSEQLGAGNASGRASVNQAADVATALQSGGGEGALGGPGVPSIGPSVVKTATVQVAVPGPKLSEALGAATAIAARYGGFVESKTTDDSGDRSGVVVMRVPAGEFEAALQELQDAGDSPRERFGPGCVRGVRRPRGAPSELARPGGGAPQADEQSQDRSGHDPGSE
ncbi:MAG: DUF4349 domain-containing protein [Actinobacteria bacterium]|nr:DUF4349 domain-containing protein [Actinomycetota bacterium]